jgi:hypothetical protein
MTYKEPYAESGYFEIKLADLNPKEEIIVELTTVGLAEVHGKNHLGFAVNQSIINLDKKKKKKKKNHNTALSWDMEIKIYFDTNAAPPEVFILSETLNAKAYGFKSQSANSDV